ncbi:MAG: LD-carboxypeptidase [Microscillaceae bacterium]|jgi:muramoyltetrapeptide carboxypeptidase|nr:LD-carboxypeptidase [Microscillaceae bacterium]
MNRRNFLQNAGVAGVTTTFLSSFDNPIMQNTILKPPRLKTGDTIGLVCPAGAPFLRETIQITQESVEALGFKVKLGKYLTTRSGYFTAKDTDRAQDLLQMFADTQVKGILAVQGGWGSARLLNLLDYDLIRKNPKVLIGYSDITALLNSIFAKSGLITFHGPVGASSWNSFSTDWFKKILMLGESAFFQNPKEKGDNLTQVNDRIMTINGGKAKGKLLGGNLTILSTLMGTPYLPDWKGNILFVEDINEGIYKIDRMLTHLRLAGVLGQLSGFVFGKCTDCGPGDGVYGSATFEDLLDEHIKPLGIPAFYGAMIGHIGNKFTIPVGVEAEIDAGKGTIQLLESPVSV